jgi:hypothetical protein
MPRRLLQLYLGLVAYSVSMIMMLQAQMGLMPWDVLHQGVALRSVWPLGRVTIPVGVLVLLVDSDSPAAGAGHDRQRHRRRPGVGCDDVAGRQRTVGVGVLRADVGLSA